MTRYEVAIQIAARLAAGDLEGASRLCVFYQAQGVSVPTVGFDECWRTRLSKMLHQAGYSAQEISEWVKSAEACVNAVVGE